MRIWNDFFQRENGFERKSSTPRFTWYSKRVEAIQYFNQRAERPYWFWVEVLGQEE
jgi:hypothetical protein